MMFGFASVPYKLIGIVVVLLATNATTAYLIYDTTADYYDAKHQAEQAALLTAEPAKQKELQAKMSALETKAQEIKTVEVERVKYITKEVRRVVKDRVYVDSACQLTPDGVRIYNAAAAGVRLEDPEPQAPVVSPEPATTPSEGKPGRPAGGGDGSLRRVPRLPS